MALSASGTLPDIDILFKLLCIQVATSQQVPLYSHYTTHKSCIAVMALSAEGTDPDIDVLLKYLCIQVETPRVNRFHCIHTR